MLPSFLLVLSCAVGVAVCDTHTLLETKYSNSLVLSSNAYELYWSFDPSNQNLSIGVRVKTLGWVGLGVSERGGMENADIVTGRVMNGNAEVTDRFASAQGFPPQDAEENWFLIGGSEEDGWTTLEFWRYLDTGDAVSDRVITEMFNPVIYAWGTTDTLEYHETRRGSQAVNFVQGDNGPTLPPDAKTFRLRVDNVVIPEKDTTYWCEGFILPEEIRSKTRHIIKVSALIHEPASAHVHHMLLYSCDGSGVDSFTDEQLRGSECLTGSSGQNDIKLRCIGGNLVGAWAVGGTDFVYPEDVSFSIGGPDTSKYMVIEMHYDNPVGVQGVTDNSGFEFTYQDCPRCFDAGVISVGHQVRPTMVIPPEQNNFNVFGVCDSSCTQYFPEEGITIFANVLHTHLAGHGLTVRHYRNGDEVTPSIDQDLNYDFNYQQYRSVTPRKVMPGDVLELECNYRSTGRNSSLLGGLSTLEEMCLTFFSYYPRSNVTLCESRLPVETLLRDLRFDEVGLNFNQDDSSVFYEALGLLVNVSFPWDAARISTLSDLYANSRMANTTLHQCTTNQDIVWTPDEAEVEGCALCTDGTGGAAELKLSGTVFFLMSTVAAFLLVA